MGALICSLSYGQSFLPPAKNTADYRYKSTYENAAYLGAEKYNHHGTVDSGHEFLWKSVENNNLGPQSSIIPGSTSLYHNIDECGYVMQAYLSLYRSTGKLKYLESFVRVMDNVLQRRDDYRYNINSSLSNVNTPTWQKLNYVSNNNAYADMLASGILTYPMADFVYLIKVEKTILQGMNAPVYSAPAFKPSCTTCNSLTTTFSGMNYNTIADLVKDRVHETLIHHNSEWGSGFHSGRVIGFYRGGMDYNDEKGGFHSGEWVVPLNYQATIGRTHLMMWRATGNFFYEDHARRLANNLRANMQKHSAISGPNKYYWKYWDQFNQPSGNLPTGFNRWEDMSHASYDVHFAYLCYKHNLKYSPSSAVNVFDVNDMNKLANTFLGTFYGDRNVRDYVNGTDATPNPINYITGLEGWVPYIEFNKDLYPIFSEIFSSVYTSGSNGALNPNIRYSTSVSSSSYYSGFAHLREKQRNFNPLWEVNNSDNSEWTSATTGDLNGNGIVDVITVRNIDNKIYGYEFDLNGSASCNNGNLCGIYQLQLPSGHHSFLTTGNFDGQPGDELAVLNKFNATLYFFKYTGSGFVSLFSQVTNFNFYQDYTGITSVGDVNGDGKDEIVITDNHKVHVLRSVAGTGVKYSTYVNTGTFGSASDLVGAASGDIDGDGIKEFITARNYDSNIYGYKVNPSGTLSSVGAMLLNFPPNTMKWKGITAGDFDADRKDEIALAAASDGDIYIYKYVGGGSIAGSIAREQYLGGYQNYILAAGDVFKRYKYTKSYGIENEECCPRDEMVVLRNLDGRMYVYETNLESGCPNEIVMSCPEESDDGSGGSGGEGKVGQGSDGENLVDSKISLKAYPNPAKNNLSFDLVLPEEGKYTLALYDTKGRVIRKWINNQLLDKGFHQLNYSLNNLEPGSYIYRLTSDKEQNTGTIMITP